MKMISIRDFAKSAQIMFIKRLCSPVDAKWKHLSEYLMDSYRNKLKWKRPFKNIKDLPKTQFYRDLLSTWCNFTAAKPESFSDFLSEPLFHNDFITINGRCIASDYTDWIKSGISIVNHILKTLQKRDIEAKYNIITDDMKYNKIVSAVSCFKWSLTKILLNKTIKILQNNAGKVLKKLIVHKYIIT